MSHSRNIVTTLAAGAAGICVAIAYGLFSFGLLSVAVQSECAESDVMLLATINLIVAVAAARATSDWSRLQLVQAARGRKGLWMRQLLFLALWLAPMATVCVVSTFFDSSVGQAMIAELFALALTSFVVELVAVAKTGERIPTPLRVITDILTSSLSRQ